MMSDVVQNAGRPQRLASLDALRGFDMVWILYPTYPIFHALLVAMGMKGCWLDVQMTHPDWVGFTFYDTIFPLFLFIAGVSWPFSHAAQKARGVSVVGMSLKIVRRALTLLVLGWIVGGILQFDLGKVYTWNALGVIGVAWAVAAFVYLAAPLRVRVVVWIAWLIGYWALLRFVPAPGSPEGVNPILSRATCLCGWVDANFLTFRHCPECGFATLGSVATAMLGMFVGDFLRLEAKGLTKGGKAAWMAVGALVLLGAGLAVAFCFGTYSMPVIKSAWTSSFVLVAGAYSLAMLALFYWLIDVRGYVRWSFPLKVIGMNAVFAYCASRTVFPWKVEMNFLFGGVMSLFPADWGAFVGQLGYVVVYWLLLFLMYRKNLFLRA